LPFATVAIALLYWEKISAVKGGIDYVGSLSYSGAILITILTVTWIGEDLGILRSPVVWLLFVTAVLLGTFFVRHESRTANPIIAPDLLRHRPVLAANAYNLIFGMGNFGVLAYFPTYFQDRYGYSAGVSGALLTPRAVAQILLSIVASVYIIKFGYRIPMIAKCLLQALTLFLLSLGLHTLRLGPVTLGTLAWLSFLMVVTGTGLGIGQPASNNAALDILPGKIAAATGIRNTFRLTGGLIGTSMVSMVLAIYGKAHEANGFESVFNVLALLNLINIPIIFFIPDTARLRRHRALQEAVAVPPPGEPVEAAEAVAAEV